LTFSSRPLDVVLDRFIRASPQVRSLNFRFAGRYAQWSVMGAGDVNLWQIPNDAASEELMPRGMGLPDRDADVSAAWFTRTRLANIIPAILASYAGRLAADHFAKKRS
jgi:hypothetical protein